MRRVYTRALSTTAWAAVVLLLVPSATSDEPANSFTVGAGEFDRGNVAVYEVGMPWADAAPCVVNGGVAPNTAEYDIDFPVTARYTIWACYASAESRPVDLYLDEALLVRGVASITGGFNTSSAQWEKQIETTITRGRHTFKFVCPGPCIPHIVAFRFESSEPFPPGWKRRPRPLRESVPAWSGRPEPGKYGYEAYVRPDGFVDAPDDYDPLVPYELVPPPAPRAERILEYLLMGQGRYEVSAEIEPDKLTGGWQATLRVQVGPDRIEQDVLPLETSRIRRMIEHSLFLLARFREMDSLTPAAKARMQEYRAATEELMSSLERLEADASTSPDKGRALYDLYVRAYRLKNRIALSNPLLDFHQLLLVRRFTYDTSHIYTTYFDGSHRYGGDICILDPVRPDGTLRPIPIGLPGPAIYRDPDLHWDATKLLFSYKRDLPTPCHIYEVNLDGTGLRQLTNSDYDDIDPCYLPDGRIMFVSTRCRRVVLCHNAFTVSVLYTMDAYGGNVRCVSANTVNDFTPSVLPDGRVVYCKWEYVDKQLGNNQSLWVVYPDGSNPRHIAGEHWGPITFWEPRAVPGSNLLVCTLAPHMPIAVGAIALVDPADACASPARYENITREIPPPRHFGWQRPRMGYYCNPYPLSEDFFIVSYNYGPDDRAPKGYGLYLLDRWNNRDLIYRDPDISCFEAIPVRPRPRPPAMPRLPEPATKEGTFLVLDVYQGLTGVPRGAVKYLRVVEEIPKPVAADCSGLWLQHPLISYGGHLALKRLLGEVPVAPDGSVYFRAPADTAIYFSLLDENYMEIQRMRAFTEIRPGQVVSCIGCHEPRHTAPPTRMGQAFVKDPVRPVAPPGGPRVPDFVRDVQPILNRHCLSCHSGPQPAGGLNLSPAPTNLFNVAYENLMSKGLVSYVVANYSSTLPLRPPKFYGSHASRLIQVLRASHADKVHLSPDEWRELVTWIDLNAPYYSTYRYSRPGTVGGRELLTPRVRSALHDVFRQYCASCHGGDFGRIERVNFEDVMQSPALLAPLSKDAGGTGACGKIFSSLDSPGAEALVAALRLLEQEIRDNPREDMLPDRPPIADENPRYIYRP